MLLLKMTPNWEGAGAPQGLTPAQSRITLIEEPTFLRAQWGPSRGRKLRAWEPNPALTGFNWLRYIFFKYVVANI